MAKDENEIEQEAEVKKSYQATLIPKERSEELENEEIASALIPKNPEKKSKISISYPALEDPEDEGSNSNKTGITVVLIDDEMKRSYINYAMSVIVGRALPDARDGLKPVHRRILFAMKEAGITHDKSYKKSARVVGDVLGKYHPHGDTAVYDSIVRMVQPFSLRYPLIDGQGNFGSIDGDEAAAMRYTEVRMDKIAEEMLADLEKETVPFRPNYDGSMEEPEVLPTKLRSYS